VSFFLGDRIKTLRDTRERRRKTRPLPEKQKRHLSGAIP
jgi:hypothetical protein